VESFPEDQSVPISRVERGGLPVWESGKTSMESGKVMVIEVKEEF